MPDRGLFGAPRARFADVPFAMPTPRRGVYFSNHPSLARSTSSNAANVGTLNRAHYTLWHCPRPTPVDSFAVNKWAAAAGGSGAVVRFGLVAADSDGRPGNLIQDFGVISMEGATGTVQLAVDALLPAGLFYVVTVWQVALAGTLIFNGLAGPNILYDTTGSAATSNGIFFFRDGVTGALPSEMAPSPTAGTGVLTQPLSCGFRRR